jgi:hypothetical protein
MLRGWVVLSLFLAGGCAAWRGPALSHPPSPGQLERLTVLQTTLDSLAMELASERTCERTCELGERICEAAGKICEIGAEAPADADLGQRCDRAREHCQEARERCRRCRGG